MMLLVLPVLVIVPLLRYSVLPVLLVASPMRKLWVVELKVRFWMLRFRSTATLAGPGAAMGSETNVAVSVLVVAAPLLLPGRSSLAGRWRAAGA